MNEPLNKLLHNTLVARYGVVKIANAGQAAARSHRKEGDRVRVTVRGGEQYRINCPVCRDTHHHLYISYLFGMPDDKSDSRMLHLAFCQRCQARASDAYLIDVIRPSFAHFKMSTIRQAERAAPPIELERVEMPHGTFAMLQDLSATHPACAYLAYRGYDYEELGRKYYWMFCSSSEEYFLVGRIFIPMLHVLNGGLVMVGYQSRTIPDVSAAEQPKYWTMSGFAKSQMLYNLNRACGHDTVVITEGVTDAARVGDNAVALLGKTLSREQHALLLKHCSHARVAVLLDSDAQASAYDLVERLNTGGMTDNRIRGGAFRVLLNEGDPGDYSREELARRIDEAHAGVMRSSHADPV